MTVEEKSKAAEMVTCIHEWDRESLPVMLVRPGGYQLGQTYEAFPCTKCGALLVMSERNG